jgi:hypothetical protein
MWIFTRYGFYSIACARKPDGSIDPQCIMVRARQVAHLKNLQKRFPALTPTEVFTWPDRDYRYRLIIPKTVWVEIVTELAREQEWSNFKNEVANNQGTVGSDYVHALHQIWGVMFRLQSKTVEGQPPRQRSKDG